MSVKHKIKEVIQCGINKLVNNYQGSSLTDILISVDKSSGEMSLLDDEENLVISELIDDWTDDTDLLNDDYIIDTLKAVLVELESDEVFSSLDLHTPLSIHYVDESNDIEEELLFITDDSTIQIDTNFLDRMDKDFDDFLDKLMKE